MSFILRDVYDTWVSDGGIFGDLQSLDVPWQDDNIAISLGIDYYGNHSGQKTISPLVNALLDDDHELSFSNRAAIAQAIFVKFNVQWIKLYATLSAQYNPISNYDMTETEEISGSGTDTGTVTDVLDRDTTAESSADNDTGLYGFNSTESVPSDTQSGSGSASGTEDSTNTETRDLATSRTEERTLTRSGNIGVTTSQQMIQSEIDLWQWNFFEQVYKDIDTMLTVGVYSSQLHYYDGNQIPF